MQIEVQIERQTNTQTGRDIDRESQKCGQRDIDAHTMRERGGEGERERVSRLRSVYFDGLSHKDRAASPRPQPLLVNVYKHRPKPLANTAAD